jgi:hypothetical protein
MDSIALYEQKLHQTINTILGIDGVLEKRIIRTPKLKYFMPG